MLVCQIVAGTWHLIGLEVGYTTIIENGALASWAVHLSPLAVKELQAKVNAIPSTLLHTPV